MKKSEAIKKLEDKFGFDVEGMPYGRDVIDFLVEELGFRVPISGDLDSQLRASRLNEWEKE